MTNPPLNLGSSSSGKGREELVRLLQHACTAYTAGNTREAADALCTAGSTATRDHLYREAAMIRKAITILAQGGKPRLLTRGPAHLDSKT